MTLPREKFGQYGAGRADPDDKNAQTAPNLAQFHLSLIRIRTARAYMMIVGNRTGHSSGMFGKVSVGSQRRDTCGTA